MTLNKELFLKDPTTLYNPQRRRDRCRYPQTPEQWNVLATGTGLSSVRGNASRVCVISETYLALNQDKQPDLGEWVLRQRSPLRANAGAFLAQPESFDDGVDHHGLASLYRD